MKVAPCSYDNSGGELCEDRVVSTRYKPCNAYYKSERQKGVGVVLGERPVVGNYTSDTFERGHFNDKRIRGICTDNRD